MNFSPTDSSYLNDVTDEVSGCCLVVAGFIEQGRILLHSSISLFSLTQQYTTSIKQPRFENLSKFHPVVHMKISSPGSVLVPKL